MWDLTYGQFKELTTKVRIKFRKVYDKIPKEIEIACQLSEAVISPSKAEKAAIIKLLKGAVLLAGGGIGGSTIAGIAADFFLHEDSPESITEKAINALKNQIQKVEDQIWSQIINQEIGEDFWFGEEAKQ